MTSFLSWLSSQSGISLTVALIALGGVLITTNWNIRAADRRRKEDQDAADQRRKEDQEAADRRRREDQISEDARRKSDEENRERERSSQLKLDDRARQRHAVAHTVEAVMAAAQRVEENSIKALLEQGMERSQFVKAFELSRFFQTATARLALLDIELTQPHVSRQVMKIWDELAARQKELSSAKDRGGQAWIDKAQDMQPLSDSAFQEIRNLTVLTRLSLLQFPDLMDDMPIRDNHTGHTTDTQEENHKQ